LVSLVWGAAALAVKKRLPSHVARERIGLDELGEGYYRIQQDRMRDAIEAYNGCSAVLKWGSR
jgi:hypothetical protein